MTASQQPPSEFSFPLDPGLDAELDAAYTRNLEQGTALPAAVATAGIAAAVSATIQEQKQSSSESMEIEVRDWFNPEFAQALTTWLKYSNAIGNALPDSPSEIQAQSPNFIETVNRLYAAKEALIRSGERTPSGENIGETMHITLVPWQVMKDKLSTLPIWLKVMRTSQAVATSEDYFDDTLLANLRQPTKMYRNPDYPHFYSTNGTSAQPWLTAMEYLDNRISKDGPWGVILTQTSDQAGLERLRGKSPNQLTINGVERLEVGGEKVDSLGIFEWLAMTLQHDPRKLSPSDVSWLLANRLEGENGGAAQVPDGSWRGDLVGSDLNGSDNTNDNVRPRLAVI